MKTITIGYSESREYINEYGLKSWKKSSIEVDPENDTPEDADKYAKSFVNNSLHSPETQAPPALPDVQVDNNGNAMEAIIRDIEACTEIDKKNNIGVQVGLLAYEHLTATPRIKTAYDKRLKELQK
jgi:hypothetical protein